MSYAILCQDRLESMADIAVFLGEFCTKSAYSGDRLKVMAAAGFTIGASIDLLQLFKNKIGLE